ncbi:MAG: hypothetical protein JOY93_01195 [Acidobacteriales bacterium]|nr:hypothetical protein [Terriglobales bacterium]
MSSQATATDADLILKLYDLRREAEMRKARNWWVVTFWPENAGDIIKIAQDLGGQENNWFRQLAGYWSMAASLVEHGALNRDLFLEPSFAGEMFLIYAKVKPYLKELREQVSPTFFVRIEDLINSTEKGREQLQRTQANVARRMSKTGSAKA